MCDMNYMYLKLCGAILTGKFCKGNAQAAGLIRKSSLLFKLSLYPDINPKDWSVASIAGIQTDRLETYRRRSSAYNEAFNLTPFRTIPEMRGSDRRAIERGSIAIAKSNGLKGQPCLVER